ncbi:sterol 3beta-glucosyltransferase [Thermosporothrix hazakensis]|jgi:sterol 3beta-glucosyltransferase|uniref:Sterol 3beta-glucosyltransferase n=1 Tax=Thermosporothrix hazakensis TaxID=644383 RepID=A0A326U4W3_THEHA|nr:glycosyltransferase [Thermosporothrix hazakensis]PZW27375.1 sterol 3beta-glucosyltransferase [Thermosporothrix hazakensis]GCE45544.1 hypothetical protein KTH_04130 [Thermosporothrix hazakensis]
MSSKRVRILAMGTRDDVQPYLSLATHLKQEGFPVSVGTTNDLRSFVESYDLRCVTTGRPLQEVVRELMQREGRQNARRVFFQALLDTAYQLSENTDVLVYSSATTLAAPHIAEKLQVPAIPALTQPYLTPTDAFPAQGMPALPLGPGYNTFSYSLLDSLSWFFTRSLINKWRRKSLGLRAYRGARTPFVGQRQSGAPILYGFSPLVVPAHWEENVHVTGYWFQPAPQNWQPSRELEQFLEQGPPVLIHPGSMPPTSIRRIVRSFTEALQKSGIRAILIQNGVFPAEELPENVLVSEPVPYEWLLPRVSAAVHYAGSYISGACLRHGVPSLTIPYRVDQPFWAARIAALGAGMEPLSYRKLDAQTLMTALETLRTDQALKQRAVEVSKQLQQEEGAAAAARLIGAYLKQL